MNTQRPDPLRLNFRVPATLKTQLQAYADERGEKISRSCVYLLQRAMETRLGKPVIPPQELAGIAGTDLESALTPMLKVAEPVATYRTGKKAASAKPRSPERPPARRRR